MKQRLPAFYWIWVFAGIALVLVVALAAQAQPIMDALDRAPWNPTRILGPDTGWGPPDRQGSTGWYSSGVAAIDDPLPPMPMLRGLSLTDAQRDNIFAILHAQVPALRENAKAARRAQDDLQRLVMSTNYDKATAKLLADTGARALGGLALLRADAEHQIYAMLTADQREEMEILHGPVRRP